MTELEVKNPIPLGKFTRVSPRVLVAEASDLELYDTRDWKAYQKFFSDSSERGIAIKSHYTGRVVRFTHARNVSSNGELLYYEFRVLPQDRKDCKIWKVKIFND